MMLTQKIQDYLAETLGLNANLAKWPEIGLLPYYLQDAYTFSVLELLGCRYLVMASTSPRNIPLADVRKHLDKASTSSGLTAIFATESIASYQRKRLIEHKIPFIVPGNQLYLPELAIDLREYFKGQRKPSDKPVSPSTQAILIAAFLRPWKMEFYPNEVAASLGYTAMTASRALREITEAGIGTLVKGGRERWLLVDLPPAELWKRIEPKLRSPVKRTVWASPLPVLTDVARLAGLSALARYSMIADPRYPAYAVSQEQWKMAQQHGIEFLPEPVPGSCEWQIWRYKPALLPDQPTVDPLSLLLSFHDATDERIEDALDSLRKQLPW